MENTFKKKTMPIDYYIDKKHMMEKIQLHKLNTQFESLVTIEEIHEFKNDPEFFFTINA